MNDGSEIQILNWLYASSFQQPAPQMLFDPSSSTLYVDSHLANNLQLDDGTSVELPTDVLLNSINSGQVQVINSNSKMDVGESKAVQAQVIQPGWYINISSVVEFQRWWVLKCKLFGQKSTCHQGKIFKKFLRLMAVCQKVPKSYFLSQFWMSKIDLIFSKKKII